MRKKPDPRVARHIHADLDLTPERVRAFGKEKYATRLLVLAELRRRTGDDGMTAQLSLVGIAVAAIAIVIVPRGVSLEDMPLAVGLTVGLTLGILVSFALLPVIIPSLIAIRRREHAHVWLGAYLDEVERRRSSKANKKVA
jgi:hypothetical protein